MSPSATQTVPQNVKDSAWARPEFMALIMKINFKDSQFNSRGDSFIKVILIHAHDEDQEMTHSEENKAQWREWIWASQKHVCSLLLQESCVRFMCSLKLLSYYCVVVKGHLTGLQSTEQGCSPTNIKEGRIYFCRQSYIWFEILKQFLDKEMRPCPGPYKLRSEAQAIANFSYNIYAENKC